ncbi:MAG: RAMP superfamily CRISPR-associated protein [Anaerolineae bacterium]
MRNGSSVSSRSIVQRIIVRGNLDLDTPTSFGNGEGEDLVDMPLALDPLEGRALLTGASLAGALRSYLRQRELGYGKTSFPTTLTDTLFGYQQDDTGEQSLLIVNDSLADEPSPASSGAAAANTRRRKRPVVELRDGVAIDASTRTAEDDKKFDYEALAAGTVFPIEIELLIQEERAPKLRTALAVALEGFERREIPLGRRKRRGLGQCHVATWEVVEYDLCTRDGLLRWLRDDRSQAQSGPSIAALLETSTAIDRRQRVTLGATFCLDSSLLIRSAPSEPREPDMIQLHSRRGSKSVPVLSGTSLVGALRGRALRICKTLGSAAWAGQFVDDMFGPRLVAGKKARAAGNAAGSEPHASVLTAAETEIRQGIELVQSRVKIDRFTGGSYPTALFSEQPVFGSAATEVDVKLELHGPTEAQIGLLLFLLKDLWTSDLPLGGEVSVGRGRLVGKHATLTRQVDGAVPQTWTLTQQKDRLTVTDGDGKDARAVLEAFAAKFLAEVKL